MMKVGLIGFGGMGRTHASLMSKHDDVKSLAVADVQANLRQWAERDLGVKTYEDGFEMIKAGGFDDFRLRLTYLHAPMTIKALESGCHVFCENQCRSMWMADRHAEGFEKAGKNLMIGQVLRFWDEYVYLKKCIDSGEFGKLRALSMTRVGGVSVGWEGWFLDEERGGMQIFDRHIHDTDAIIWMLGTPKAVQARGFERDNRTQGGIVHSFTNYLYGDEIVVSAEGSAAAPKGFPFTAAYRAFFDNAVLEFNGRNKPSLLLYKGGEPIAVDLGAEFEELRSGLNIKQAGPYFNEQVYFFDCILMGIKPKTVTPAAARETIRVIKAEIQSARTGQVVQL